MPSSTAYPRRTVDEIVRKEDDDGQLNFNARMRGTSTAASV